LKSLFPRTEIQPKGLLATEAFVSIPLIGRAGAALAVRSHFFEFEEADGGGVRLAHELAAGGRYRVVVTTGGGLYRYRLMDEIEVVGFEQSCPLIRFQGRTGCVSDLAGEKLDEVFVQAAMDRVFSRFGIRPAFAMLSPDASGATRYCLYFQADATGSGLADKLRAAMETALAENPYYRQAVALGQLAPLEAREFARPGESLRERFERTLTEAGRRLGGIKPAALAADRRVAAALEEAAGTGRPAPATAES
jgi:hypothetical protein